MAEMNTPETPIDRLCSALTTRLAQTGIKAEVWSEPLGGTTLSRVVVVAKEFAEMPYTERQDLVWRIAGSVLSTDEQLRLVSGIYTIEDSDIAAA